VRAGEETLRRSIAAAADGRTRARLRVDLAELLRARDAVAARTELDHALREGGPTGALTTAAVSFARTLAPADRLAWLSTLARGDGKTPAPVLVSALAEAQLGADLPRDAALTWLGLARDERVPLHHRRAAARKAARLGDRLPAADAASVAGAAAELAVEKRRRPRAAARETADAPPAAPATRPPTPRSRSRRGPAARARRRLRRGIGRSPTRAPGRPAGPAAWARRPCARAPPAPSSRQRSLRSIRPCARGDSSRTPSACGGPTSRR
jgi:hypothetical protein